MLALPMTSSSDPTEAARRWADACYAQMADADRDMARLEKLLTDAGHTLSAAFLSIEVVLREMAPDKAGEIRGEVGRIVTALQFHDMASQLLAHARTRIAVAESGLKKLTAMPKNECAASWGPPPTLGNPVGHASLDAGSVDLF